MACCFKGIFNSIAESINYNGNCYFQRKDYNRAITLYSRAIIFYPKENVSKCLTNRSACFILLKNYKAALRDSSQAIRYNIRCEKAYEQMIESLLQLGHLGNALFTASLMKQIYPNNKIIERTRQNFMTILNLLRESCVYFINKNYTEAIEKMNSVLEICTVCETSIECKKRYVSAKMIQVETSSFTYNCAYELYNKGELGDCIECLKEVLFIDPYHQLALELFSKVRKFKEHHELTKSLFDKQNYSKALENVKEALKIDPLNKKMQINLNEIKDFLQSKQETLTEQHDEDLKAKQECERQLKEANIRALMDEAQRQYDEDQYELCISRCDEILNIEDFKEAAFLKKHALIQLCNQNILRAKQNFATEMYKECMENCNIVLIRTNSFVSFDAYRNAANIILGDVRKHIKKLMFQAYLSFKQELFDQCIKKCEFILNIEDSIEARNLIDNSKSEKIIKQELKERNLRKKKYREAQKQKEESELLLKIDDTRERLIIAQSMFDSEDYDKCIKECENITESNEATNLLEKAKSEKVTKIKIQDRILRVKKLYATKNFKECIKECHNILKKNQTSEIKTVLINIKAFIDKTMAQANRKFELEYFDQCIEACQLILDIDESPEASNLLELAKNEEIMKKRISEELANARHLYKTKFYKACVAECKQILKIKDISEAKSLIELCETAQIAAQLKLTNRLLNFAKKCYEIKDYKKCLANCYKILKITELKEARDLIQKVKTAKQNQRYLNDIMSSARQHFENKNFKKCKEECIKALRIEEILEAITLMENADIEIQNAINNIEIRLLNARQHFSKAEYKECIENCSAILQQQKIDEVNEMLIESKSSLKYERCTDPYDVLQVPQHSNQDTIRTSYHLLSLKYHPDKHSKSTIEMRSYNEDLYKKITNAYSNLRKQSFNS